MLLLIIYLLLALIVSFACSIMEAVLLSTPISYLNVMKDTKKKAAENFIELKENIDKPLSAILSLNTIAHTVGAAGVGAQATIVFGEESFGIVSAILTLLILVLTEIIPKTVGARWWRELCLFTGYVIAVTVLITFPLVKMSSLITRLLSKRKKDNTISREEISALANIGTEEGVFGEKENKIIQNLITLKKIKVSEVMTPRVVVVTVSEELSFEDFMNNKEFLQFSRIPVYSEEPENIIGFVLRQKIFESIANNQKDLLMKDIKRDIIIVPESMHLYSVWEELLLKKEHIALVIDEYGGMAGIVTMEDIIETLLGFEITDETDRFTDMQEYARQRWNQRKSKYKMIINKFESDQQ